MELPILALFLASFILTVGSHPKNSDTIPKEYYRRQILPPIPGYIPVYIQADPEPIIIRQTKTKVLLQKDTEERQGKQMFKQNEETLSKSSEEISDEVKSEAPIEKTKIKETKTNVLPQKDTEEELGKRMFEQNEETLSKSSEVNSDEVKSNAPTEKPRAPFAKMQDHFDTIVNTAKKVIKTGVSTFNRMISTTRS